MAQETEMVTVKLDPEQMELIKKNYLDMIDRVIQERQEIKGKMGMLLEHSEHAWKTYREKYSLSYVSAQQVKEEIESMEVPLQGGDDLGYHIAAMITLAKQVYDSIQVEVKDEDHPDN